MIFQVLETNNFLSVFWQNFFLKNKKVKYKIMRTANRKTTTVMLLNKDRNTNSILEIKLVHFKLEPVWFLFFYLFLYWIIFVLSKSVIIFKQEFHFSWFFSPKYELTKKGYDVY